MTNAVSAKVEKMTVSEPAVDAAPAGEEDEAEEPGTKVLSKKEKEKLKKEREKVRTGTPIYMCNTDADTG